MTTPQIMFTLLFAVPLIGFAVLAWASRGHEKWYHCSRCNIYWSDHGGRSKTWPTVSNYCGPAVCDECRHPIEWKEKT